MSVVCNRFTRREFLKGSSTAAIALAGGAWPEISLASNPVGVALHGLSAFGDLKYGPDAARFSYGVDAPKGGEFAFSPSNWSFNQNVQTFNTLNSFVLKGEAPPRMELCFDTLMAQAWDEPDSIYGLLAKTVTISPDRNEYRFALRPEARFADGSEVTSDDVAFSLQQLKEKGHPQLALDLTNLETAETAGAHEVVLRFNGKQSARAILAIASTAPVFNKAWFSGRAFDDTALEPIPGSGPYKVGKFQSGLFIEYERRKDYWGADLAVASGIDHFDKLRVDFFQERTSAFEAFKKGEVRWREEFTSKVWATEYVFPAVSDGRVKQAEFSAEKLPSLQGWAVNTRRAKLSNPLTRRALATLFDFEWTNRNLFYDAYSRSHSMFEKSDLAATGLPDTGELALLEPMRARLDPAVLGEAVMQNVTDGSGRDRSLFRKADALFQQAGWRKDNGALVDAAGEKLAIEILIRSQVFERILGPYTQNMRTMGITADIRLVDPSQFQSRIETFDFDMVGLAFSFEANPTAEALKRYFHSSSANQNGSSNYPGISDPAVDAVIGAVERAQSRDELVTAVRALDRVLRAGQFWIPNWHAANHRVAWWDMFAWQEPKPDYAFPVERLWWYDRAKAEALGQKQ
ncbi:MAG: extracellular solute-binding protein [Nitratireductor sp.]